MLGNLLKFARPGFKGGNSSFGIDIGTWSVKMVKLNLLKEGPELAAFNSWPVQTDLKSILANQGIKKANISVGGFSTVIRYVNFLKMNKEELRQALKFEAQKHIPFSADDCNLDGYILNSDLKDGKMLVLLAAAKKDLINQRYKLFEDCGIKVNLIDLDSIALVNAFSFNHAPDQAAGNKAVALLNIGASFSNLNILEDGVPFFSRDIHIAGNSFTQKIAEVFGIDSCAAEELKINPDKEKLLKVTAAVEAGISSLAAELRTSFDYYESQRASSLVKIFLSGSGSLFPGLKDNLANFLGTEVESWNPFKNVKLGNDIDQEKLGTQGPQLSVALGLALRSMQK